MSHSEFMALLFRYADLLPSDRHQASFVWSVGRLLSKEKDKSVKDIFIQAQKSILNDQWLNDPTESFIEYIIAANRCLEEMPKESLSIALEQLMRQLVLPCYARIGGSGDDGISIGKRKLIFERDAYRCVHCGSWKDLCIDHIYPKSKGGLDEDWNLQTLCRACNSRKGDRLP